MKFRLFLCQAPPRLNMPAEPITIEEAGTWEMLAFFLSTLEDAAWRDNKADIAASIIESSMEDWRASDQTMLEVWRHRMRTLVTLLGEAGITLEVKNRRQLSKSITTLLTVPARPAYDLRDIFPIAASGDEKEP